MHFILRSRLRNSFAQNQNYTFKIIFTVGLSVSITEAVNRYWLLGGGVKSSSPVDWSESRSCGYFVFSQLLCYSLVFCFVFVSWINPLNVFVSLDQNLHTCFIVLIESLYHFNYSINPTPQKIRFQWYYLKVLWWKLWIFADLTLNWAINHTFFWIVC